MPQSFARGIASRVLVPTQAAIDPAQPNIIFAGIAHVMSRVARLESPELIPIREIELDLTERGLSDT